MTKRCHDTGFDYQLFMIVVSEPGKRWARQPFIVKTETNICARAFD